MPPKKRETQDIKLTGTQLRTIKSNTKTNMKLFVDAEVEVQRKRHFECLDGLDASYQRMKRQAQDLVEVNQRLKKLSNDSLTKYDNLVNEKIIHDLSEERITAELVGATKTCEKAVVLLGQASKTLEEMNDLLGKCRRT